MTGHSRGATRRLRLRATMAMSAIVFVLSGAPAAGAEPGADPMKGPYPSAAFILSHYTKVKYDDYFTDAVGGVWFTTPLGLNCGIWDRGSFGCTGDIPGAPPGTTNIGWVNGNIVMRYDWLLGVQFPPGRAQRDLPPRSYIEYNGTRCTTMADTSTHCSRGPFQFLITPSRTWLSPP